MSDIPKEMYKIVARDLHDRGKEMTPSQVKETKERVFRKIREELRARGFEPPVSDIELLALIQEALKGKPRT